MACVTILAAIKGGAPKVNVWLAWVAERPMCDTAASSAATLFWATARSSVPWAVGTTCRVVRSNSRKPSCVSNSRIKMLNPDGVM